MAGLNYPGSIKGLRLRLTRLDDCDRPIAATVANSRLTTAAYSRIGLSYETEEGTEITQKNANGDYMIDHKDINRLRRINMTSVYCETPLLATEMMTGSSLLQTGGDVRGLVLPPPNPDVEPPRLQIEVWTRKSRKEECEVGVVDPRPYWYFCFPLVKDFMFNSDMDIVEDNAVTFSFGSRAEANPNYAPSLAAEQPDVLWTPIIAAGGPMAMYDVSAIPAGDVGSTYDAAAA